MPYFSSLMIMSRPPPTILSTLFELLNQRGHWGTKEADPNQLPPTWGEKKAVQKSGAKTKLNRGEKKDPSKVEKPKTADGQSKDKGSAPKDEE